MSQVTNAFREHHRELDWQLSKHVAKLAETESSADTHDFVAFLKNELLPHAAGEEAQLYPVMDEIVRAHGKPTETMQIDHEYIKNYIARIEEVAAQPSAAVPEALAARRARLAQLGSQLSAIFEMHLAKEERVYLPLLEQYVSEDEQQRMLDAMHQDPSPQQLDVRLLPPAQRHALIFQTFDALALGTEFELVNDHDPKPLYYQFAAERAGEFTWDYAEKGPQVWRVRIGRTGKLERELGANSELRRAQS
jgi:uncharacterized protein (DUF2249 family)/hemerythrin-like domain-containing protein